MGFGRSHQRGFTLIELLVVVVVMMAVTAAVITGVGNIRGASLQAEAGKLSTAVRYLYNLTVLSGRAHRLVIDLDSRSYWGEEQTSSDPCEAFLLPGEGDDEDGKPAGKDGEEQTQSGFSASNSRLLAKYTLDQGIKIQGVMTSHQVQPTEKGQAYVYFFPNGTTESAVVHLEGDQDDVMTVEVLALQGSAKIHKEKHELEIQKNL